MSSAKFAQRKFVSVDPSKCTGCGICEYTCSQEKGEEVWNPLYSRIRVVRMKPLFNFALTCRACDDAKCVTACPEKALSQCEETGALMVNEKKCKGCDWCVQACPHGGITIHPETGLAIACNLCDGEPQCVEFCPEEALEVITTDEEAEKRFNDALEQMPKKCEELNDAVTNKDWKPLLAEAEQRSQKVAEKLEGLSRKGKAKKGKQ
ncbi:MAG: 4Fe-4S dicluster domain-containing protein [Candidatus Bathyarchaeota archaeon]|nr:4Fe-4S dicluster domain-containing protein [Candidatus Bathyarchaeota archaeon]